MLDGRPSRAPASDAAFIRRRRPCSTTSAAAAAAAVDVDVARDKKQITRPASDTSTVRHRPRILSGRSVVRAAQRPTDGRQPTSVNRTGETQDRISRDNACRGTDVVARRTSNGAADTLKTRLGAQAITRSRQPCRPNTKKRARNSPHTGVPRTTSVDSVCLHLYRGFICNYFITQLFRLHRRALK